MINKLVEKYSHDYRNTYFNELEMRHMFGDFVEDIRKEIAEKVVPNECCGDCDDLAYGKIADYLRGLTY